MSKKIFYSTLIFLMCFIFRAYAIPHAHHVYYDEFVYQNIAENIYYHNIASGTSIGGKHHIEALSVPVRPNGYPMALSFAFKLLGDSEEAVFLVNIFLGALSVVLIFWIAYFISNSNLAIAFWSSVVFNFLPVHIKYSTSGNVDIMALFFVLLSLWVILLYLKKKRIYLLYVSIPITAYAAYLRPENIIFGLLLFIVFFFLAATKKIRNKELILLICFMLLLIAPFLIKFPFMISREQINSGRHFFSLEHFNKNSLLNLRYLFDFRFHSMVSTLFFIAGGMTLFFREKKIWLFLISWFLLFYCITSSYFSGVYSLWYTADSDRYFLLVTMPFSILAGYGVNIFLEKIKLRIVFAVLILSLLMINSTFATECIVNHTFGRDVYKEYLFLKETARQIPDELYIVSYLPASIITVMNKKAYDIESFSSIKNFPEKIVLMKGFWWFNREEDSAAYEKLLKKLYHFRMISERHINSHTYGFYLLTLK
jgi:4-amino-4-deoxy-L-arabinose transferase-like glycosyltransferase